MSPQTDSPETRAVPDSFTDYAAARDDPRFTHWLRDRAGHSWTNATDHRFTRELGADELDEEVFRRYLLQDSVFLDGLVRAFGYAVGQAPALDPTRGEP
jgi:thiaminase/transcriptional activator TenA